MTTQEQQPTKRTTPDWLVVRRPGSPVLFFICMLTILAIGWGEDRRSCQRQIAPRLQGVVREEVLKSFLLSAAHARLDSANHESGIQKAIDLRAYHAYTQQASRLKPVPLLNCSKLLPDT